MHHKEKIREIEKRLEDAGSASRFPSVIYLLLRVKYLTTALENVAVSYKAELETQEYWMKMAESHPHKIAGIMAETIKEARRILGEDL